MKAGAIVTVFYAGMLYQQLSADEKIYPADLPDGAYIYVGKSKFKDMSDTWYLKDLTPVLLEDVPKELLLLKLLLT